MIISFLHANPQHIETFFKDGVGALTDIRDFNHRNGSLTWLTKDTYEVISPVELVRRISGGKDVQ